MILVEIRIFAFQFHWKNIYMKGTTILHLYCYVSFWEFDIAFSPMAISIVLVLRFLNLIVISKSFAQKIK